MTQARPDRGTKRTCLTCESRFYDLARIPAICPKCGAEYVEVVRPAPAPHPARRRGAFGKGRPDQPIEIDDGRHPATYDDRSEGEEREPADDREEGFDDEAESEVEDQEE